MLKGQCHFSTSVVDSKRAHGYRAGRQNRVQLAAKNDGSRFPPSWRNLIKGRIEHSRSPSRAQKKRSSSALCRVHAPPNPVGRHQTSWRRHSLPAV
ncbi:hypothetical protein AMELA_G00225530 [Ameiurus melas]|uniref:Uncharacterized protein n=1 Tax=Ameiurus melas TaxID=219545 RepID=A0A7J5ZZZ3_AMEME|nr:hypothetical protein AMELA_G00225530 [Ameiurus melas]